MCYNMCNNEFRKSVHVSIRECVQTNVVGKSHSVATRVLEVMIILHRWRRGRLTPGPLKIDFARESNDGCKSPLSDA